MAMGKKRLLRKAGVQEEDRPTKKSPNLKKWGLMTKKSKMNYCLAVGLLCSALSTPLSAAVATETTVAPNIVLILTDDQSTYDLDSLAHMPKLKALVADEGVTVANSFVTTPVCCPARSSLYTGKYIHNIGVFNNSAGAGGCASLAWQFGPEQATMARFLHDRGYATSFAGKYMNNYGYGTNNSLESLPQCLNATLAYDKARMTTACAQRLEHVPRGWDNWHALRGNSVYYNYTLSNNGVAEVHGDDYARDYLIDLAANRSVEFIEKVLGGNSSSSGNDQGTSRFEDSGNMSGKTSQQQQQQQPVFVVVAVPAAHEPADPAPQHSGYGEGLTAPRTPNFNQVMGDDARHWMIANVNGAQGGVPMNASVINFVDLLYRRRLATLQSVDDLVESVVSSLQALPARGLGLSSALEETFLIFTADNGYHLGQFAVALDKRQPYETDLRVPIFLRGPGLPRGVTVGAPGRGAFLSIDLAPTFLQLAGMETQEIEALGMDGEPMAALLFNDSSAGVGDGGRDFLVEYYGENFDGCSAWLANDFPTQAWSKLDDGVNCGLRGDLSFVTEPTSQGMPTWSSIQDSSNNTYNCVRSLSPGGGASRSSHSGSGSDAPDTATTAATIVATDTAGATAVGVVLHSSAATVVVASEAGPDAGPSDEQFCAWDSGEEEHFDLLADPWQLVNTAPALSATHRAEWRQLLKDLKACEGRAHCAKQRRRRRQ